MNQYDQVITAIQEAVRETGGFIRAECGRPDPGQIESKGLHDLVTYVDRTAEKRLVDTLQKVLPEAGFITEEQTIARQRAAYTWIIDPLDGTTNFVHGVPVFSISIGLMHHDRLVAGLVYEVNRDEMFSAVTGQGAWLNGVSIRVSDCQSLGDSLIGTGFPVGEFELLPAYLGIVDEVVRNSHGIRRGGSAATDLAYVACGRFDAFFEYNLNPWDVAAGILLVREAGGRVSDFGGGDQALFGKEIIAGGPVHAALLEIIRRHWPGSGAP